MTKRFFDVTFVLVTSITLLPFIIMTYMLVSISSKGPALFWSKRVGINNHKFQMPKFRSMQVGTPQLATHLMNEQKKSTTYLTPVGQFIRKTSLDELPQLWSVLKGDMSIVGPRPALYNQEDLIALRTERNVHRIRPGITGWAQVNGRDELSILEKVKLDQYYLNKQSFWFDCKIILLTLLKVVKLDGVSH